ncbi:MAG: hypothetical protein IIB83_02380 [Bacteroidetes bacterium]|nr:hypothetical protein [Bacteroidota bacterium]
MTEIKKIENRISKLEAEETDLGNKLTESNLYDDYQAAIKINSEYKKTKDELEKLLSIWEDKQGKLNGIKSKFS